MRRLAIAVLAVLLASAAGAQNVLVPTRPAGDSSNAAASTAFTQNAASNPAPPITIAPTANTLGQGLLINQTLAGSQSGSFNANNIIINSNAAFTGASAFLNGVNLNCSLTGTTVQGGINCAQVTMGLNSPSNASNVNHNYVGLTAVGQANSGDGGTNTGAGAQGAVFATNFVGNAVNGATNLLELSAGEVDCMLQTGSSAKLKMCWSLVSTALDKVHGATVDSLLTLGAQTGSNGVNTVINFTTANGIYPAASGGTLIGSDPGTVALAIDFNNVTCTTGCFRQQGFLVNQTGQVTLGTTGTAAGTINLNGSTSGQLSLIASPTANNLTVTQPVTVGVAGTVGGQVTLAGATSGSRTLGVSATGAAFTFGGGALSVAEGGTGDTGTAWSAFTSSPSCGTATITNNSSRSKTLGKTTWIEWDLTITALGTCSGTTFALALPNTAQSAGAIVGSEVVNNSGTVICRITAAGNTSSCFKNNSAGQNQAYAANDRLVVSGVYENQ